MIYHIGVDLQPVFDVQIRSISGVDKMLDMSIGAVIKLVDASGIDEKVVVELVESLREAFQEWVRVLRLPLVYIGCG